MPKISFTKAEKKPLITDYQPIKEISPKPPKPTPKNFSSADYTSFHSPLIIEKEVKINEPLLVISKKEQILLNKIKQLKEQLAQVQAENKQLKIDKEQAKALVQVEKERADNYQQQLKIIAEGLYQWVKINYYQQLEQEQKAQIEQPAKPPNFKK